MRAEIQTSMGTTDLGVNEDFAEANLFNNYCLVLDGASGLTKKNQTGWKSDSAWFSRTLGENLAYAIADKGKVLESVLAEAGVKTAQEYHRLVHGCELAREDEPSAALVIARWGKEASRKCVEVAALGDCLCVVGFQDGTADIVYDNRLDIRAKKVRDRMRHLILEDSHSSLKAREIINEDLLEIRSLRNQEGGYFIADPSCVGYGQASVKRYSGHEIRYLFMCSDGFYNAVKIGICSSFVDLAERVVRGEGKEIMNKLRAFEHADSEMLRYQRFKICDDATYALVVFEDSK